MAEISATCKLTWKANFVENTGMYGNTLKWLLLWSFVISQTSMLPKSYATCTSPIMHLFCPPKFCITFAFHVYWILQPPQEKLKTMLMQNFGGQIRCIMGDVQGHIKRNSKLNLMLLASNLHISHCLGLYAKWPANIFNILWHLWMASLKLYLQFKLTK